jgi:hypothetical protein
VTDPILTTKRAEVEAAWTRVWRTLLIRGIILVLVVAALGMGIGWLVSGIHRTPRRSRRRGIGRRVHHRHSGHHVPRTEHGTDRQSPGSSAIGFLFKAFIFMIVIWRIKDATWLDGTVAFFTIVVAVIGLHLDRRGAHGRQRDEFRTSIPMLG